MRLFFPKLLCVGAAGALSALAAVQPRAVITAITAVTVNPTPVTRITKDVATTSTSTSSTKATSTAVVTTSTNSTTKLSSTSTKSTTTVIATTSTTNTTTSQTASPTDILNGNRTEDIFAVSDIKGFYNLPDGGEVIKNATLNATNIQGDILIGMRKKMEAFYFFTINDAPGFKKKLHNDIMPMITDTLQLLSVSTQPLVALNLAFSQSGFNKLGIIDNLQDSVYSNGQTADANNLGDTGTSTWVPEFIGTKIHGVFLIASDQQSLLAAQITVLESILGTFITKIYELDGQIRPPPFEGHEMFGYLDGVSQPAVAGFNINPVPGQQVINPGVILVGEPGDTLLPARPGWTKDGSFLVFRQLRQLVPEFNKFLWDQAPALTGMTQTQSADLLGARMVGRWKSGAPIDLSPLADNPALGADPNQNNDFDFFHTGFNPTSDESHCPFAAHIRFGLFGEMHVTDAEIQTNSSSPEPDLERGLAFVSYQSRIDLGFQFIQRAWENDPGFPFGKIHNPGHDPISGQNNGAARFFAGYDISNTNLNLAMPTEFVVSRGGEYFFSPSIEALRDFISV
ncbi:hypothetical protein M408DRAFT_66228 [Serendipita vermifera MAFF 305830]|uniref:DyP dimeric alpha+beta barrel domain-containing protein n=1 Tax=Serendipita vermifera MAFF 305830 TaxID=933852 RepID=A0A0C3B0S6_SERVB|nr:hypothetical protein M408DRAFT_66228 [Serendipita vermifera MAFF 305830]